MDPSDITFVIPIFRLTRAREENFWFTLDKIRGTRCSIIVVEQQEIDKWSNIEIKISHIGDSRIRYYADVIDDKRIHKSRLINLGTSKATTSHVWVNDIDCFLNFSDILKDIPYDKPFIRPFDVCINLTQEQTSNIISNYPQELDFTRKDTRHIRLYGALSFIYNKQAFLSIGGMDESFVGWGLEDHDINDRVCEHHTITTLHQHRGVHLWHALTRPNIENWHEKIRKYLPNVPTATADKVAHIITTCSGKTEKLALDSLCKFKHKKIIGINATNNTHNIITSYDHEWLEDSGPPKLIDLLNIAAAKIGPKDYILYTNSDCIITSSVYSNILYSNSDLDVILFHRRDVLKCRSLDDVYKSPYTIEEQGIDGLAIRKSAFNKTKDHIHDVVVGMPWWDPYIVALLESLKLNINYCTTGLYHMLHKRSWSLLPGQSGPNKKYYNRLVRSQNITSYPIGISGGKQLPNRKPQLYTFFTPSHKILFEEYLKPSALIEYNLNFRNHEAQPCKTGSYATDGWRETQYYKTLYWTKAIEDNYGDIIVCCDADIQFVGKSFPYLESTLRDNTDISFQQNTKGGNICSGFFACRCNDNMLKFMKTVSSRLQKIMDKPGGGEQYVMWQLLSEPDNPVTMKKISHDKIWTPGKKYEDLSELDIPDDIRVHHANWTEGLDNKIAQLEYVKKTLQHNK